jgi:signal transduction histidine kinase
MIDLLRHSLGEQIQLDVKLVDDVWPVVVGANQLKNALLNLEINSRDAMPDGGQLTIETASVSFDEEPAIRRDTIDRSDYTVISIFDTGFGMAPDILAKVFEPFFTTKPIGQGTGLGLSMVYGFVSQSNGHVRVESEIQKATTIRLYFPRFHGEMAGQRGEVASEAPRRDGETVLMVEDDSSVRLLIAEVLRDPGDACLEANDDMAKAGKSAAMSRW